MPSDEHRAVEAVRALYQTFNGRDREAMLACLADEVTWHVPGDHPMAGTYEGRDAVWEGLLQPLWPSPARADFGEIVAHGDHVVAFGREIHDFGEGQRAWESVEVLEVRDGKVAGRWAFTSDQAALDTFLTRGCAAMAQSGAVQSEVSA